jgi:hypothetical protein
MTANIEQVERAGFNQHETLDLYSQLVRRSLHCDSAAE